MSTTSPSLSRADRLIAIAIAIVISIVIWFVCATSRSKATPSMLHPIVSSSSSTTSQRAVEDHGDDAQSVSVAVLTNDVRIPTVMTLLQRRHVTMHANGVAKVLSALQNNHVIAVGAAVSPSLEPHVIATAFDMDFRACCDAVLSADAFAVSKSTVPSVVKGTFVLQVCIGSANVHGHVGMSMAMHPRILSV